MEFVTDRTQYDVDLVNALRAKGWKNMTSTEQRRWDEGLKGAYNYTDLNRVESNVADLGMMLGLTLTTKTDWEEYDRPTVSEMKRYIGNVWAIRENCNGRGGSFKFNSTPRTMDNFAWFHANYLEMDLESVYRVATEEGIEMSDKTLAKFINAAEVAM